jgi:type IV pilus assembly protein PilE
MLKLQHKFEKSIVKQQGFTLIELMITVAIVGILASIAIPSYSIYVLEGKIPDATSNLAAKRVQMEQYYQDNLTYLPSPSVPCITDNDASKYFIFICSTSSSTAYTITATGVNSMAGFKFSIDQSNHKTSVLPAGWSSVSNCWATNNHGGC